MLFYEMILLIVGFDFKVTMPDQPLTMSLLCKDGGIDAILTKSICELLQTLNFHPQK